jgi:hypothetical protein
MLDLINKADARLRGMKHVDGRDLALQTILPLLKHMQRENDKVFAAIEENFHELFLTLHLVDENKSFLDATFSHITGLHQFVDEVLLSAGFVVLNEEEGGIRPAEHMPSGVLEKLLMFQAQGAAWFAQYEAVRAVAEEELEDDADYDEDDDDDGGDDDDSDGDDSQELQTLASDDGEAESTSDVTVPAVVLKQEAPNV